MDKIVKAIPLENHLIEIQTSNGISGIFDVKPYLGGSAFNRVLKFTAPPPRRPHEIVGAGALKCSKLLYIMIK